MELISHFFLHQGSLIANMIMGIIILKKKYTLSKYLSVAMISLGIVICTIMSSTEVVSKEIKPFLKSLYNYVCIYLVT